MVAFKPGAEVNAYRCDECKVLFFLDEQECNDLINSEVTYYFDEFGAPRFLIQFFIECPLCGEEIVATQGGYC